MEQVTRLRADPHEAGYVVVDVDGARYTSLPVETVRRLGLEPGAILSEARRQAFGEAAAREAAYQSAVRSLTSRPRARRDLVRRLQQRGHSVEAAEAAAERLAAQGVLDDARFARQYTTSRLRRGYGRERLLRELFASGVDGSIATAAVAEVLADAAPTSTQQVRELVARRAQLLSQVPAPMRRRRLLAFLARRGHRGIEARALVDEFMTT